MGQIDKDVFERGFFSHDPAYIPVIVSREFENLSGRVRFCFGAQEEEGIGITLLVLHVLDSGKGRELCVYILARVLEFQANFARGAVLLQQILRRIRGTDAPLVDHHHTRTHHFDFGQNVRRNQNGAPMREVFDELPHLPDLVGIEADGRFVEDEQIRVMNQGVSESDPLFLAFGEGADQGAFFFLQVTHFEHISDAVLDFRAFNAFERGSVAEVFMDPHIAVEGGAFREVSEMLAGLDGLFEDIKPGDGGVARRRGKVAREHAHGGAFSGAVGPEETDDLSLVNFKGNIAHSCEPWVALGEMDDFDHKQGDWSEGTQHAPKNGEEKGASEGFSAWDKRGGNAFNLFLGKGYVATGAIPRGDKV